MPAVRKGNPQQSITIPMPPCPRCGGRMWLTRIEPDKPGYEQRVFSCTLCQHDDCRIAAIGEAFRVPAQRAP
jgi:hypothetical protein